MRNIWVISDTHLNHANMLKFTGSDGKVFRPFNDVIEMNERIVQGWNSVVSEQDIVYHLGDVYLGNGKLANDYLYALHGHKRLVLGNHDNGKDQLLQRHFQKIMAWRMWPKEQLLLTHFPAHAGSLRPGMMNVHGHIHQNQSPPGPYFNVCVEPLNYVPMHLDELVEIAKGKADA